MADPCITYHLDTGVSFENVLHERPWDEVDDVAEEVARFHRDFLNCSVDLINHPDGSTIIVPTNRIAFIKVSPVEDC